MTATPLCNPPFSSSSHKARSDWAVSLVPLDTAAVNEYRDMRQPGVYTVQVREGSVKSNTLSARGPKNVPGRKSDVQECPWLRTYGLLCPFLLPPPEIHVVRTFWRLRIQYVRDAGRCLQQMQKLLFLNA